VLAKARSTGLLSDRDIDAAIGDNRLAMLLRGTPIAFGGQAIKRFARTVSTATFVICDVQGPGADVRMVSDDALVRLERKH
jgi:hypothetical protein